MSVNQILNWPQQKTAFLLNDRDRVVAVLHRFRSDRYLGGRNQQTQGSLVREDEVVSGRDVASKISGMFADGRGEFRLPLTTEK
ncbi:hypothetical protein RGR602_PC00543 (plasmid) [Rhizobium gallicum bv. gallicum R602sp]|uniref:Uncharacterized protein n=1 Tax=Rhizobium gallicum bv. gallicum R602sp TaxID=1041138 RepID=A0A0B4XDA2_9HYPH|nr:hypothetical protein RGR602_PC00543 [Rhizobium gallicum bv. gallicum R602sp]